MSGNPHRRRTAELALFTPVHRLHRVSKGLASPSFDLDEGHNSASLRYEVEVSVTVPEAAIEYSPPLLRQPDGRDPLALLSQHLRRCRHERKDAGARQDARIEPPRPSSPPRGGGEALSSAGQGFGVCPSAISSSTFAAAIPATGVSILRSTLSLLRTQKCSSVSPTWSVIVHVSKVPSGT